MPTIPDSVKDLLEKPIVASLTTIAPDGIPENTAIWALWDGEHIMISTADGRRKPGNIRNNPNVAVFVIDPENTGRWLDVRGVVEEMVDDENYKHVKAIGKLYTGDDNFTGGGDASEKRLVIKIKPLRVASQG